MSSASSGYDGETKQGLISSLLAGCDTTGKYLDPNSSCASTEMSPNVPVSPAILAKAKSKFLHMRPRTPPRNAGGPPPPPPPPSGVLDNDDQQSAVDQQAAHEADGEPQAKKAKPSPATMMTMTQRVVASGGGGGPGGTSTLHGSISEALQVGTVQYEQKMHDAEKAEQARRNENRRKPSHHTPIDIPANRIDIYEGEDAMSCSSDGLPVSVCQCCNGASGIPSGPEHLTYFHGHYVCQVCLILWEIIGLIKEGKIRSLDELMELLEVLQAVKLALSSPSPYSADNVAGTVAG